MPALSLKTKIVLSITAMVVAIVATLSTLYISQVVRQRIQEVASIANVIELHMFAVARPALTVDLSATKIDLNDPEQVAAALEDLLQGDTAITSLMDSVSGDSKNILDASIVDTNGLALLHTNPALQNTIVPPREDFANLLNGGIRRYYNLIYGPTETYDSRLQLTNFATGKPFGEVRVGINTTLLRDTLRPEINKALALSASAILLS